MEKITLYNVITNEIRTDSRLNPFSHDFDPHKTTGIIDAAIEEHYKGLVEYDADGAKLAGGLNELNHLYLELYGKIRDLLSQTGLSTAELIAMTIATANFSYLNLLAEQGRQAGEHNGEIDEMSRFVKGDFKNMNGTSVGATDVSDSINDSAVEVINILSEANFEQREGVRLANGKLTTLVMNAIQTASILDGLKENFNECIYETATIKAEADSILIAKLPEIYFKIMQANRLRQQNQSMEYTLTGLEFPESGLKKPNYKIEQGKVILIKSDQPDQQRIETYVLSQVVTFNDHLLRAKLENYEHYRVNDIVRLITLLKIYFNSIDGPEITKSASETQDCNAIPYKIEKAALSDFLQVQSGFDKNFVERFLESMSQPLGPDTDIWLKPLIQNGDDYLFLLGSLGGGHLTCQFDSLIDSFLNPATQKSLLRENVKQDMNGNKNTLKFIDTQAISAELQNEGLLVFQLLKQLLVIEVIPTKIPLNSQATSDQMVKIMDRCDALDQNCEAIKKNIKQLTGVENLTVRGLLLTNHAIFSGIGVGSYPVMDKILLSNYVNTGKYARAIIITGDDQIQNDTLASYPYYHDDESFDKNLLSFMYHPAPVTEILRNLQIKNFQLIPAGLHPIVFTQHAELRPLRNSIDDLVKELEDTLKQLYYFQTDYDKKPEGKQFIEDRILFLTPLTFSFFAIDRKNRESRMVLLENFKKVGFDGMIYLVTSLDRSLIQLTKKKFIESKEVVYASTDHEKARQQMDELADHLKGDGSPLLISPSTFEPLHKLNDADRDNLVAHLINAISAFEPAIYSDEQFDALLLYLTLTAGLGHGLERFEKDIYSSFLNVIDLLNHNGHHQRARDIAEEALAYSFKYETVPVLGWLALFKCFTAQRNVLDAAFYGCAYLSALYAKPAIPLHQVFDGFYNSMLFYRNFGFSAIVDRIYRALAQLPLDTYELQKLNLSYLNSKIGNSESLGEAMEIAQQFLDKHILDIMKHGQQGAIPWTALIYNMVNAENLGLVTVSAALKIYLAEFEKQIDETTLNNLKGQFFPNEDTSYPLLKDAIVKSFETRYATDFAAEVTKLELLANNVANMAVNSEDVAKLLLSGFVINDQSLVFHNGLRDLMPSFDDKQISPADFVEDYGQHLLANIPLRDGQVLIWLFEYAGNVAMLAINSDRDTKIIPLPDWNMKEMKKWIDQLPEYLFDDKNGNPINFQEQEYVEDLKKLAFSRITIPFPFKELLVAFSLEMASFPPNLLEVSAEQYEMSKMETHEAPVEEYVMNNNYDFVGYHKPITNIISLEYLAVHGDILRKKPEEMTLACWVPTVDGDMPLYIAENKLKPVLVEKYGVTIQNSVYPKPPLSANINFFVAHGYKTVMGFRSVHTRQQDEGHALVNDTGVAHVFGTGFIAVVFICDSGAVTKDLYKQQLNSFVNEVLSLGYKAVVAPSWKYNPLMTGIWTEVFLESMQSGQSVSFAVQAANHSAAKNGFDPPVGFYAPNGWAAMHLYGNPNLFFQ